MEEKNGLAPLKNKRRRTKKRNRRPLITVLIVLVIIAAGAFVGLGAYVMALNAQLPDITAEDLINAQTSFVYDENNEIIATLHSGENRISVDLDEIPDHLKDALIASEDIRFYSHNGVDLRSVMRSAVVVLRDSLQAGEVTYSQGASTLTMQLVKNVIGETDKNIPRKIKQALLAVKFEKQYDKDEILYHYLNEIYLGPQVYGVQAASHYYFNKDVADISVAEAATLVAILRSPGYYSPYENPELVVSVRDAILELMVKYAPDKYSESAPLAMTESLVVYEGNNDVAVYDYPWFVDYVISEAVEVLVDLDYDASYVYTGGLSIYTTMDPDVQQALETVYADDSNFPGSSTGEIVESAMSIVQPSTGQIKGLVGGRVYETRRGFNRASSLVRSPGSTIKPLVAYAPAIEMGYGAGTVIDDSKFSATGWSPNNDDYQYNGRITMRTAVMRSRNVCAVKMLNAIGTQTGYEYGLKMGLPLVASDANNLALTLGGLTYGVSPLEMAGAFATFANEGVYIEPYAVSKIVDADGNVLYSAVPEFTDVFTPATAYVMTDILCSAVEGGTGYAAKIYGWQTAGKTGTNGLPSEDPDYHGRSGTKDAWFCGYTTALSGAVWVGYDNKSDADGNLQYLSNVYGGTYPARIFNAVMTQALANYQNRNFVMPSGVISVTLDTKTGKEPTDLTPQEYIGTDYFTTNGQLGYVGLETAWGYKSVCAISGLRAGPYCPTNSSSGVGLYYVNGEPLTEEQKTADDFHLYVEGTLCTEHTEQSSKLIAVEVCTDPRHTGDTMLANIAGAGESNGCPDEYVETRYFTAETLPSKYCNLFDHQLQEDDNYQPGKNDKPDMPTGLSAATQEEGILVSWDYGSSGISFVLERTNVATGDYERFLLSDQSYLDTGLEDGETYSFRVYAYNRSNQQVSGWTSSVSATFED